MNILREFLESSTIHGIRHISTAQVSGFLILSILNKTAGKATKVGLVLYCPCQFSGCSVVD